MNKTKGSYTNISPINLRIPEMKNNHFNSQDPW